MAEEQPGSVCGDLSSVVGAEEGGAGCGEGGGVGGKVGRYADAWVCLSARLSRAPTKAELAREVGVSRQAVDQSPECAGMVFSRGQDVRPKETRARYEAAIAAVVARGVKPTVRAVAEEMGRGAASVAEGLALRGLKAEPAVRVDEARRAEIVAGHARLTAELGRYPTGVEFVRGVVKKDNSGYVRWAKVLGLPLSDGRKVR